MNTYRALRFWLGLTSMMLACSLQPVAAQTGVAGDGTSEAGAFVPRSFLLCPEPEGAQGVALIPYADLGESRILGGDSHAVARAIANEAWFSTLCPVAFGPAASDPACTEGVDEGAQVVLDYARMRIQKTADHRFRLALWNPADGTPVADVADLTPYRIGAGGRLAVTPPFDFLRGDTADGNRFFVYFHDGVGAGWPDDLEKHYVIEVYYPDPYHPGRYLCEHHMPDRLGVGKTRAGEWTESGRSGHLPRQGGIGQGQESPPDIP
jgi:hypothetical protein